MNATGPHATDRDDAAIAIAAAQWHVASTGDAMDWDAFTLWLEADPRHRDCYDQIAMTDAIVHDHAVALALPDPRGARRWSRWAAGGALAAMLALVVMLVPWRAPPAPVITAGDTVRDVALSDGSRVVLAPHSRLTVAGDRLTLDGQAHFAIRHNPARTMQVAVGALTIRDIGTVFDAVVSPIGVRIAVSEGRVAVTGTKLDGAVPLRAGDGLQAGNDDAPRVVRAATLGLAGWTGGTLDYADAPLPEVAADIARLTGIRLTVAPALRTRRFSGSLLVASGPRAAHDLARLIDVQLVDRGGQVMLVPPHATAGPDGTARADRQ